MFLNSADVEANKNRFISRIIESQTVFYLTFEGGVANSVSNEEAEQTILMFWSDKAYARRVQENGFEEYEVSEISLFEYLYQWLPGMSGDDVLAGVNWNQELVGRECDPFELRTEIESKISESILAKYEENYRELTENV